MGLNSVNPIMIPVPLVLYGSVEDIAKMRVSPILDSVDDCALRIS